jgi:hypothetical protein
VNIFKRFDAPCHERERISFDRMVDPTEPDRLHHSDSCVRRVADALADVIVMAVGEKSVF